MTNEEKATEISKEYEDWWAVEAPDVSGASFESAMAMAEWKDNKFYAILACIQYSFEKQQFKGVDEFINDIKKQWEE